MEAKVLNKLQEVLIIQFAEKQLTSEDYKQSGRQTYLFDKFVIKFDTKYNKGAKEEFENWKRIKPKDRKYFAEVFGIGIFEGKNYIIQERVFPSRTAPKLLKHYETLNRLMDEYDLEDIDLSETNATEGSHNVVIDVNGSLKIFDYAGFSYR